MVRLIFLFAHIQTEFMFFFFLEVTQYLPKTLNGSS